VALGDSGQRLAGIPAREIAVGKEKPQPERDLAGASLGFACESALGELPSHSHFTPNSLMESTAAPREPCTMTSTFYAAALAPAKGRLSRCTVAALTPNGLAILRTPSVRRDRKIQTMTTITVASEVYDAFATALIGVGMAHR
jgi:hypothetical protein